MPDARIPSLAPVGLDVVPGYTLLPNGKEDPSWREHYFAWHQEMRAWRVATQREYRANEGFAQAMDAKCVNDTAFFVALWLEVQEPRAMAQGSGAHAALDLSKLDDIATLTNFTALKSYQTVYPFIPFAYQVRGMQTFDQILFNEEYNSRPLNVLWDKARGVGFTYAMLAAAFHAWLFYEGVTGTILTEKWDKADRTHSKSTLFGKFDVFFNSLPKHLVPEGYRTKGDKDAHRLKGTFAHPSNGCALFSEPPTASATRSGRDSYIMIDEGAFQEYLDEMWATCLGTTFHILAWSTASLQKGLQWQSKVDDGKKDTSGSTKVIEIDYYEHPAQDAAWRAQKEAQFIAAGLKEQFEVEYLRNAHGGSDTLVYAHQVDKCPVVPEWYDPRRTLNVSVDPGVEDATAWVFWQHHIRDGKKLVRWLDSYEIAKMPVEFHAHLITGIPPKEGDAAYPLWMNGLFGEIELYFMDWLRTVPPSMVEYYGDPAVLTKDYSHESFAVKINQLSEELRERESIEALPVFPMGASWKPIYKRNNFNERRAAARQVLMFSEFSDREGALLLKLALKRTRFQEMTEKAVRAPGHVHDRYSHRVQAFEFGALWETLELTDEELAPAKPTTLEPIARPRKHAGRKAMSPYQRQTKTLLGVA